MATRAMLTYTDYAALPDDGLRYELHQGELRVTPAPGIRHQEILIRLASLLYAHVSGRGLGKVLAAPTDCILADGTVVQPDILFVASDRLARISERAIEGPPTLAVEILSPSTVGIDRGRKRVLYAEYRVPHLWIVDPEACTIEAYDLVGDTYRLAALLVGAEPASLPPFPDLSIAPASVWP